MRGDRKSKNNEDRMALSVASNFSSKVVLLSRDIAERYHGGFKTLYDLQEAAHRAGFYCMILPSTGWQYFLALARLRLPYKSIVILPYHDLPAIRPGGLLKAIASLCEVSLIVLKKYLGRLKLFLYVYDLPIEQRKAFGYLHTDTHPLARLAEAVAFRASDVIGVTGPEMEHLIRAHHFQLATPFVYYDFLPYYAPRFEKKVGPAYPRKIAFVGDLDKSKKRVERFAQLLPASPGIEYYFYGPNGKWLEESREDFRWCGSFKAEELSAILNKTVDFGLLFYGNLNQACLEYLHMATTSKFLAYLYAGLPILAFSYRRIARVIQSYGLGYVFDDPAHLANIVLDVDERSYCETARRVAVFAQKLALRNTLAEFVDTALKITKRR